MALLEHAEDLEPTDLVRANTGSPLMQEEVVEGTDEFQLHRPREKKDRRGKLLEESSKKGSSLSLRRAKQKDKDVAQEKTPRKGKHVRSKSGSRTPPESPKAVRSSDGVKKQPRSASVQLQPSPNVKSSRKRYYQLGEGGSSSDSEPDNEESFLVSNTVAAEKPPPVQPSSHSPSSNPNLSFASTAALPAPQSQPFPLPPPPTSPTRRATVQFPIPFPFPVDVTPERSTARFSIQEPQPLVHDLPSPGQPPPMFFQSPMPKFIAPSQHPAQAPRAAPPPPTEAEWAVSEELHQKCVRQFSDLQPVNGFLHGDKARDFFVQSRLPNHELSQIWYEGVWGGKGAWFAV